MTLVSILGTTDFVLLHFYFPMALNPYCCEA